MKRSLKIKLTATALFLIAGYALAVGYFYKNQRNILFQPQYRTTDQIVSFAEEKGYGVFKYKTQDGLMLTTLFKQPKDDMPIIMLFNGNAAKVERAHSTLEQFIEKGYGAVINIYRGYGDNPGLPSQEAFFNDAETLFELVSKFYPRNEIILFGYSLGSATATYLASIKDVKALIIESGFSSASDLAKAKYPFLPVDSMMKDKFLVSSYMHNVSEPVIVLHGLDDNIVDIKFAEKLSKVNPIIDFKSYEAGDHRNLKCLDAYKDVLIWLDNLNN